MSSKPRASERLRAVSSVCRPYMRRGVAGLVLNKRLCSMVIFHESEKPLCDNLNPFGVFGRTSRTHGEVTATSQNTSKGDLNRRSTLERSPERSGFGSERYRKPLRFFSETRFRSPPSVGPNLVVYQKSISSRVSFRHDATNVQEMLRSFENAQHVSSTGTRNSPGTIARCGTLAELSFEQLVTCKASFNELLRHPSLSPELV